MSVIHCRESFGWEMSAPWPSVLAEVAVYPAQVVAAICESFLLAAQLSARVTSLPLQGGLNSTATTTSR